MFSTMCTVGSLSVMKSQITDIPFTFPDSITTLKTLTGGNISNHLNDVGLCIQTANGEQFAVDASTDNSTIAALFYKLSFYFPCMGGAASETVSATGLERIFKYNYTSKNMNALGSRYARINTCSYTMSGYNVPSSNVFFQSTTYKNASGVDVTQNGFYANFYLPFKFRIDWFEYKADYASHSQLNEFILVGSNDNVTFYLIKILSAPSSGPQITSFSFVSDTGMSFSIIRFIPKSFHELKSQYTYIGGIRFSGMRVTS